MRWKHEEPRNHGLDMQKKEGDTYVYVLPYLKLGNWTYTHLKHDERRLEIPLPSRISPKKRGLGKIIASLSKVIKKSATILGLEIGKATDKLSRALEDGDANEKRLMINSELKKLSGLTMFE